MKAAAFFLFVLLSACRTSESIDSDPPKPAAKPAAAPVASVGQKVRGVELIDAPPGDVATLVRAARDQAKAHGRKLLVYIGATWCEPCQHFHHAAERGELDEKFPTLSLLVFDLDRDGERLRAAQYAPGYIPYFGAPGEDGKATSNATEGSIKGDGAVGNITPRLEHLIQSE